MERPTVTDDDHETGVDDILKMWNVFDTSFKGKIGKDELALVLQELDSGEWHDERVRELLIAVDTNKDGSIDIREFFAFAFGDGENQEAFRLAMNLSLGTVCIPGQYDGFFWSFMTFPPAPADFPVEAAALSLVRPPLGAGPAPAALKEADSSESSSESAEEGKARQNVSASIGRGKAKARVAKTPGVKKALIKSGPKAGRRKGNTALLIFGGTQHLKVSPSLARVGVHGLLEGLASAGMCHLQPWLAAMSPVKPGSLVRICHEILSFPPEPRIGFSLTPLDDSGRRVLVLGGYSARGCCLESLDILDFSTVESGVVESEGESDEEIFFADHFRTEICSAVQKDNKSKVGRSVNHGKHAARDLLFDEANSSGSENEYRRPDSAVSLSNLESKVALTSAAVLAALDGEQVRFHRCDQLAFNPSTAERAASREAAQLAKAARWRRADQHTARLVEPRAGHAATLACPTIDFEDAIVLVQGGLNSIGGLLSDLFEVHVCENLDGLIDAIWHEIRPAAECSEEHDCLLRAFHSAVLWPSIAEEGQHSVVLFGGVCDGPADSKPQALRDTVLLTCCERELPSAGDWRLYRPKILGPLPPGRWGHSAALAGGPSGGGTTMTVCGGVDALGSRMSDCWVLDLESLGWAMLEEPGIPRGLPAIGLAPSVWADDWNAMLVWGACTTGLLNEADALKASRVQKVQDRARQRRLEAERRAKKASRVEAKARKAAEKADREEKQRQQKERRAAELAQFAEQRRQKVRADLQSQKEEEKKRFAYAEDMKKLRTGGGFDMKKAAALRNSTMQKT